LSQKTKKERYIDSLKVTTDSFVSDFDDCRYLNKRCLCFYLESLYALFIMWLLSLITRLFRPMIHSDQKVNQLQWMKQEERARKQNLSWRWQHFLLFFRSHHSPSSPWSQLSEKYNTSHLLKKGKGHSIKHLTQQKIYIYIYIEREREREREREEREAAFSFTDYIYTYKEKWKGLIAS
jgi:hypothetical protein